MEENIYKLHYEDSDETPCKMRGLSAFNHFPAVGYSVWDLITHNKKDPKWYFRRK